VDRSGAGVEDQADAALVKSCCRSDSAIFCFAGRIGFCARGKSKIALFCNLEDQAVITAKDVESIYEVPLTFSQEGVDRLALRYLHIETPEPDLSKWSDLVRRCYNPVDEVSIAIAASMSVRRQLQIAERGAGARRAGDNLKLTVTWIEAEGWRNRGTRSSCALSTGFWCRVIRQARDRRDAERDPLRARAAGAVFRDLPGYADGVH